MQSKIALPVVLVSLVAVVGLAAKWVVDRSQVHQLTLATGSPEGEYYNFGDALADVVARQNPKIRIAVRPSDGAPQNIQMLENNEAQLAIVQSDTPVQPSMRAVAYLFAEAFHLIARNDSGIQSMADLRGKRVALMPENSGSYQLFQKVSPHYGLTPTNFESIAVPSDQAYDALRQGRVDALFRVIAAGNPSVSELLVTAPARLVPIDQAAALQLSMPYLEATQIPKGTYSGANPIPAEDLPVVAVRAVLVARADVSPEVVRDITRILFESRNEIVTQYPRAASMRLPEAGQNLGLPIHRGASAYYNNNEPSFLVEYADTLALLLSLGALAASGLWQLRSRLIAGQKNRADRYNLQLLALIGEVESVTDLQQLEQSRRRLFEIFEKVVTDLDQDRLSSETFQSFVFPWEVALSTIRHREMVLINSQKLEQTR